MHADEPPLTGEPHPKVWDLICVGTGLAETMLARCVPRVPRRPTRHPIDSCPAISRTSSPAHPVSSSRPSTQRGRPRGQVRAPAGPRGRVRRRVRRARGVPRRRWVGRPLLGESRTPGGDARRTRVRFFRRGRRRGDRHRLPRAGRPRGRARARRRDELQLPRDPERLEPPAVLSGPLGAASGAGRGRVRGRPGALRARTRTSSSRRWTRRLFFSRGGVELRVPRGPRVPRGCVPRQSPGPHRETRAHARAERVVRLAEHGGVVVGAGDPDAADAAVGAPGSEWRAAGDGPPGHQGGGSSLPEEEDALAPLYEREDELFSVALERLGLGAPRASASLAVRFALALSGDDAETARRVREPHGVPRVPAPVRTGRRCRAPAYVRRRRVPAGVRQARRRARRDVRAARRRAPRVRPSRSKKKTRTELVRRDRTRRCCCHRGGAASAVSRARRRRRRDDAHSFAGEENAGRKRGGVDS